MAKNNKAWKVVVAEVELRVFLHCTEIIEHNLRWSTSTSDNRCRGLGSGLTSSLSFIQKIHRMLFLRQLVYSRAESTQISP